MTRTPKPRLIPARPRCPFCNGNVDSYTALDGASTPQRGDISLCIYCSGLLVFDGDPLTVRAPTAAECAEIFRDRQLAAQVTALGGAVVQLQRKRGTA